MGWRHVAQGFSSFLATILSYLMVFQSRASRRCYVLGNLSSNMAKTWPKKWRKSLMVDQFAFNPFLAFIPGTLQTRKKVHFGRPMHCLPHTPKIKSTIFWNFFKWWVPEGYLSKNIDFSYWGNRATTQTHFRWLHDPSKAQRLKSTFFEILSSLQISFGNSPLKKIFKQHWF